MNLSRIEIYKAILFNARVKYVIYSNPTVASEGYVVGDSFGYFDGHHTYTLTIKCHGAYSIVGIEPEQITEVVNWNIPEVIADKADEMARKFMCNVFKDRSVLGEIFTEKQFLESLA